MQTKVTKPGHPCKKCGTPVQKCTHAKNPPFKPGGSYFTWWMECPKCRAFYVVEASRVWFDMPATFDFGTEPEIAAQAIPGVIKIGNISYIGPDFEETDRMRDASIMPWD